MLCMLICVHGFRLQNNVYIFEPTCAKFLFFKVPRLKITFVIQFYQKITSRKHMGSFPKLDKEDLFMTMINFQIKNLPGQSTLWLEAWLRWSLRRPVEARAWLNVRSKAQRKSVTAVGVSLRLPWLGKLAWQWRLPWLWGYHGCRDCRGCGSYHVWGGYHGCRGCRGCRGCHGCGGCPGWVNAAMVGRTLI